MRKAIQCDQVYSVVVLSILFIAIAFLPRAEAASSYTPQDFSNHVQQLSKQLPSGFSLVVQAPFVVLGDEPRQIVQLRASNTVKFAVDRLKQDYFARDPEQIIDIWLFKDGASYTNNARKLFKETPTTPFGYYSSQHRALVMNISTGGGTLVHEIVHPFMDANFPQCPTWFNEGLASLYEQSGEKDGHIYGYTNWRLDGLQEGIKSRSTFAFPKLLAMNSSQFYADRGLKYAQARYLCYYLQEQKLLVKFFKEFQANVKEDPSGVETLKKVLGEKDLAAFQKNWEGFVLRLRFE